MRQIKYLSPSSVMDWGTDLEKRKEFYLKRLAENRPPKLQQTQPMSAGSAFDAYIKCWLYKHIFGNEGKEIDHKIQARDYTWSTIRGPEFQYDLVFNTQVEPHNREWAMPVGEYLFEQYKASGALSDLLLELALASDEPHFEFTLTREVQINGVLIKLLGKPDIKFSVPEARVIFDWKVEGFCSKSNKSPTKGYIMCRDSWDSRIAKESRGGRRQEHKDCYTKLIGGIKVNVAQPFELINERYALQTTMYDWTWDGDIESSPIAGIEQLCGVDKGTGKRLIRVASHRGQVSPEYRRKLANQLTDMWTQCHVPSLIFKDFMEPEQSLALCQTLDHYAEGLSGDDPDTKWLSDVTRNNRPY